ncbi:maleylpyruvate isomerase N-terminal domain-containing protein [Actinomycetospora sp. NBRC 106375]|uniref:maleylpyruvate isomerase N-terminal domain-containing protein n=1 Tax=Actinomycetospora sp. NBRC 106375 TaxID=3032207 RepID=UPI002553FD06|nr:maleylpyruvate isomerase N-terminal domain-containing protein [Actinomycetospora sp. NBRC 106375]
MDGIAEWTRAQQRVIALVTDLTAERSATIVPACPDWTVRDLLSHMVGLGADVVAGNEPDDHNEAWTAAQVEARRGEDVAALVAEWGRIADPLRAWMAEHGTRPLGDVTIHEQDLRGALREPGGQDTPAMAAMRERFAGRLEARLDDGLAPIALLGGSWTWCSAGEAADAAVEVRASDFDLARALMARRSAAQLRRWTTRGDVGPYLDAFATLGELPSVDLTDG